MPYTIEAGMTSQDGQSMAPVTSMGVSRKGQTLQRCLLVNLRDSRRAAGCREPQGFERLYLYNGHGAGRLGDVDALWG